MAIFDSHAVRYLTYYIVLRDAQRVTDLQAEFPDGYQFAPYNPVLPGGAAIAFNGSWSGTTDAPIPPFDNYIWSPEWTAANAYPQDVASFTRHSGGFWGIGGTTVTFYWVGRFVYKPADTPTVGGVVPPIVAPMPKRRWVEGFELGSFGPWETGMGGGNAVNVSRDASRHVGGLGLAIRGSVVSPAVEINLNKYAAGYSSNTSWERMYLRVRQVDTTQSVPFWETFAVESGNIGVQLGIVSGGAGWQLTVNKKQAGFYTFKQTLGSFRVWDGTDQTWSGFYKIDLLIKYSAGGSGGSLRIYANGVLQGTASFTVPEGGLGNDGFHHRSSGFGNQAGVANNLYLDIDDWTNSEIPMNGGVELLTSKDWLNGTKIALLRPTTYGSGHDGVAWVGDVRRLMANILNGNTPAGGTVASSTASAVLEVNTDSDLVVDGDGALGCPSMQISLASTSVGGTDGVLRPTALPANCGFSPATIDQQVAISPNEVLATVDGTIAVFPDWTPIKLKFTKAADANAVTVTLLMAQVELIGGWKLEDQRLSELPSPILDFPRWRGQHNAPYPRSAWGKDSLSPPNSPYIVYGGTYVGNNTAQDLTFVAPVHFVFIRPTTGDTGGHWWFSTMHAGHKDTEQNIRAEIVNVDEDTTFVPGADPDVQQHRYRLRISGSQAQINAVGVTYHYIAVSDPGGRFILNFDANCKSTEVSFLYRLVNDNFLAEFVFIRPETWNGTGAGRPMIKGPGNLADDVSSFVNSAKIASALTVATGHVTLLANLLAIAPSWGQRFSLWRRHDGNGDPGEPGVMAILSWTGDGSGSRTISIAPASGKRPIFAMATGDDNLGGYVRDASHLTNTSSRFDGASVTTGITSGGIDTISVGTLLNVNLVNYNMLVLFGGTAAGNGGFGTDGTYAPVEADAPADGPWGDVPDPAIFIPPVVIIPLTGEPDLDATTVLSDLGTSLGGLVGGQACEVYTRHVINMALTRIGVSKRIANVATDNTLEATMARAHILEDVNATLRAFDWPFATRYASLVLVAGTATVPVNQDWQYSYRAPNAMVKARRLVHQDGSQRSFDPNPPKFRVGSDDIGPLIYTNEVATTALPLVLEYTIRNICPAFYGDAMFRNALAWRFAESLAPVLAQDTKKQDYCRARFEAAIASAKVPAAQEQQQAPAGDAGWISDRN